MIAYLPYTFLLIAVGTAYVAAEQGDSLTAAPAHQQLELPEIKLPRSQLKITQPGLIDKQTINLQAFLPATPDTFSSPQVASALSNNTKVANDTKPELKLSAIMIADKHRYATLNGSILTEGETTLAYRVLQIKPDSVLLEGPTGRTRLSLASP